MGDVLTPEESKLTGSILEALIRYEPDTGRFYWVANRGRLCKSGQEAGSVGARGYMVLCLRGRHVTAHRLAWVYMTGAWPSMEVDHRDGNPLNNAWSNLRLATSSQNKANSRARVNNTGGVKGAYWSKRDQSWTSKITVNYRPRHLGTFRTQEEASAAYRKAAVAAFGEFAKW